VDAELAIPWLIRLSFSQKKLPNNELTYVEVVARVALVKGRHEVAPSSVGVKGSED
jgi:hypothetical protein